MQKLIVFILALLLIRESAIAQSDSAYKKILPSIHVLLASEQEQVQRWESYLDDQTNNKTKDTIQLTLDDFVLFTLFKNNIVVSDDAIEFLYANNPSLSGQTIVPINYTVKIPALPVIPESTWSTLVNNYHESKPTANQVNNYFSQLTVLDKQVSEMPKSDYWEDLNTAVYHLHDLGISLNSSTDKIVKRIVLYLSELNSILSLPRTLRDMQNDRILQLLDGLETYMALQLEKSSFVPFESQKDTQHSGPYVNLLFESFKISSSQNHTKPFKILLWHPGKSLDDKEFNQSYTVFYVENAMFNSLNPQRNVLDSSIASVGFTYLPMGVYQFWGVNNENRKIRIPARPVNTLDAYLKSKYQPPYPQQYSIIIKL